MCKQDQCRCQSPEFLKTKPQECSPEQIKKCHGDENNHPCIPQEKPHEDKGTS